MDGLKLICKSAFKMIIDLDKQVANSQARIRTMEDQMVVQTAPIPKKVIPAKIAPPTEIESYDARVEQQELKNVTEEPAPEMQPSESEQVEQEPESPPITHPLKPKKKPPRRITAPERRRNELINAPADDEFKKRLTEKLADYIKIEKTGDMQNMKLAKMHLFKICGLSTAKRKFVEEEFNKIALKKV